MTVVRRVLPFVARFLFLVVPLYVTTWPRGLSERGLLFAEGAVTVTISTDTDFKRRYEDFVQAAAGSENADVIWNVAADLVLTPDTRGVADQFIETVHVNVGHTVLMRALSGTRTVTRNYGVNSTFMVYDGGYLILENIIMTTTAVTDGSAISVFSGGKVFLDTSGFLNCFTSRGSGGAVYSEGGSVNATDVTFTQCSAPGGDGGGLAANAGSWVELTRVAFTSCRASNGGAVSFAGTGDDGTSAVTANVDSCTFLLQDANATDDGGSSSSSTGLGGDVFVGGSTVLRVADSVFGAVGSTSRASSGGCVYAQGESAVWVGDSTFQSCEATTAGGAFATTGSAAVTLTRCDVLDANAGTGEEDDSSAALGGGLLAWGSSVVTATSLKLANTNAGSQALEGLGRSGVHPGRCEQGEGSGCRRKVWRGGGVYGGGNAQITLTDLTCDSLDASGAGACLFATGAAAVSVAGAVVNTTTNGSRAMAFVDLASSSGGDGVAVLSDISFHANRRGSLLVRGSTTQVHLSAATFSQDTVSSPFAHGGSIRVDQGATLNGSSLDAWSNVAGEDGGWLYASEASVYLQDVRASGNQANGKGGAIFGESMYALRLESADLSSNSAIEGGGLFARSCARHDRFEDSDLFFGVRLVSSTFKANAARLGGGLRGESSFLYATDCNFVDNTNVGLNTRGSAASFTPDAIYERCHFKNPEVYSNTYEPSGNDTLLEGERLVLDSSSFNVTAMRALTTAPGGGTTTDDGGVPTTWLPNGVIAVRLTNTTGGSYNGGVGADSFFTLLSRNTNLGGLRVVGKPTRRSGEGFGTAGYQAGGSEGESWNWQRCNNDTTGAATSSYHLIADLNDATTYMSQLWSSYHRDYDPVCPADASCTDDPTQRTIVCACPPSSSSFDTVNNDLNQCQTYSPTLSPTHVPTEAAVTTAEPTPSPKPDLTNYTVVLDNPYLTIDPFDLNALPTQLKPAAYSFLGVAALLLLLGLLVDLTQFRGMAGEERQGWILGAMFNYPAHFHYMLLLDRDEYVGELMNAEQREQERELARRARRDKEKAAAAAEGRSAMLSRSLSYNSQDGDALLLGGSGGDGGGGGHMVNSLFRGASYERFDRSFEGGGSMVRGQSYESLRSSGGGGGGAGGCGGCGSSLERTGGGGGLEGESKVAGENDDPARSGGGGGEGLAHSPAAPATELVLEKSANPMGHTLSAAL